MQDNLGPPWRPAIPIAHNSSLREPQSDGWNSGKPNSICQFGCQGLCEGEATEERKDAQLGYPLPFLHQQHFKASLVCCWVFPSNPSSPVALGPSRVRESPQSETLKSSGHNERSEKRQNGFSHEDREQPSNHQQWGGELFPMADTLKPEERAPGLGTTSKCMNTSPSGNYLKPAKASGREPFHASQGSGNSQLQLH